MRLRRDLAADQGKQGPQSGSVGGGGVELDSGGKHSRLIEAFKDLHLAFSALSCSISISSCLVRCSISKTGRQLQIANQRRQRGNVERYSDLLIQGNGSKPGEVDMVVGAEQADEQQQGACA